MDKYLHACFDLNFDAPDLVDYLKNEPYVFWLDSSRTHEHYGRYSFIGFDPFQVMRGHGLEAFVRLKDQFKEFLSEPKEDEVSPLYGGIVGVLGYEYGLPQENIKQGFKPGLDLPDCCFGFYDVVITLDHFAKKVYITSTGFPEKHLLERQERAQKRLDEVADKFKQFLLSNPVKASTSIDVSDCVVPVQNQMTKEHYVSCVNKILDHIRAGDIYQANFSQQFCADAKLFDAHPLDIYKELRNVSPVSFGGYFDGGDFQILSDAPEEFLCLRRGRVYSRPMKGTRPRGENTKQDIFLRNDIQQSAKEKAELLMIVDLLRNDLGRVCEYGSVHVKAMREVEEYKTVFQTTATIEGVLSSDKNCFDVIQACFPGGSITGCPKIRAMQIIEELEPVRRNFYTGSFGYINFSGDMDLNILIRTLVAYNDRYYYSVGGGIVADSTPESEYEETLIKAQAIQRCLSNIYANNHFPQPTIQKS